MGRYRKKPVEIEAIQVKDIINLRELESSELPEWFKENHKNGNLTIGDSNVTIYTLEGTMVGHWTDYIICGVRGEIYPCRKDIFEETYEGVE